MYLSSVLTLNVCTRKQGNSIFLVSTEMLTLSLNAYNEGFLLIIS